MKRSLRKGSALLGVFAVGAACSYDFDQYLAPSAVNAGGHAGAAQPSGGSGGGGAHVPSGGIGAGGDGSPATNGEGGEAESSGGTTSGGAPPSEAGAPIDAGGTSGESAVGASGGSPPAGGGASFAGNGGTAGTTANAGAPGTGGDGGDGGGFDFDCAEAAGTIFNGHCYFLIGDGFGDGLEWDDARTACTDRIAGSHLVTITSEAEEQFVEATFFPATADRWIGLALADTTGNPSNSCRRTPALCPFAWVTSESLSYTKWGAYSATDVEPNYSGSCVRIQFDSIDWADRDCDDDLPAICETADGSRP